MRDMSPRTLRFPVLPALILLLLFSLLLLPLGARPAQTAFPGANGKISFQSDRDGNYEIYVMNADGSGQTNLTNNPDIDVSPAWSPDGTKIAFESTRDGFPNSEVYVMNADGSGQTRLTNNPAFDRSPAWSPDASKIAFASTRDSNYEIYVMNANGSGQTRLTNNPAFDFEPDWQPLLALTQGDVNCSQAVDILDVLDLLRHTILLPVAQNEPCPDIGSVVASFWGDVNCSQAVDILDVLNVLRYTVALPIPQNEPCADIGSPLS